MSIECKIENGVYVNHKTHLCDTYQCTVMMNTLKNKTFAFVPKECYFDLKQPYISSLKEKQSDLQKASTPEQNDTEITKKLKAKRKRRKRKSSFNQGELDAQLYHEKVIAHIHDTTCKLLKTLKCTESDSMLHIKIKQDKMCEGVVSEMHHVCGLDANLKHGGHYDIANTLYENTCSFSHFINIEESCYLVPMHSKFLQSDVNYLQPLIDDCKTNGKYNCIVLDPPWENKSVKRGRKYATLSFEQIASIPIDALCFDECLFLIWVTNKQKIICWTKEELFCKWKIQFLAEWHWVKLTTQGQPVFPWNSLHKKPYETILVGRYCTSSKKNFKPIEDLVVCSVPFSVHSHKPPLTEILKQYLCDHSNPRCLEMFARSLTPDWTSWGNEVLMMQNEVYFCNAK